MTKVHDTEQTPVQPVAKTLYGQADPVVLNPWITGLSDP